MLIAKQTDNTFIVADYRDMFPATSFPPDGPSAEFLSENNCALVSMWRDHDRETEKLVTCDPYLGAGTVYTVRVEPLTQGELDQKQAAAKSALMKSIVDATQQRLDDFAKTRNYDGILSACTYATSPTPKFQAEGQYCVEARDNTWATLYQIMREVEVGTRPMPSSYADIENELPSLTWPI